MVDQIIRPSDLPRRSAPVATEIVPVDNDVSVAGSTLEEIAEAGRPTASEAEALAGTEPFKAMTPLTTRQAISDYTSGKLFELATQSEAEAGEVNDKIMTPLRVRQSLPWVQPVGLVGDGVSDDTAAIQEAFDQLPNGGFLIIPPGVYRISDLVIASKSHVNVHCYGRLFRPDGSGTNGVTIRSCAFSTFQFDDIRTDRVTNPANWTDLTGSAIQLENGSNNCTINLEYTTGFSNAILCQDGSGGGVYFNTVKIGRARYTRYGVHWKVGDGVVGFVNGNTYSFADFRGYTALKSTKGTSQTDPFNGNHILSFNTEEAIGDAIDIEFSKSNMFSNMRFEPVPILGRWVKTSVDCETNTFIMNRVPLDKVEVKGSSERLLGPVFNSENLGAHIGFDFSTSITPNTRAYVHSYEDSGSFVFTSSGMPVQFYVFGADQFTTSGVDRGVGMVTRVSAAGATGRKRARVQRTAGGTALNANLVLPYNFSSVRVQSNSAAVKLFLSTADYYEGNTFYVNVTNYSNTITIRNENDSADVTTAINSVGLWIVLITAGFSATAVKIS